MDNGATDTTGRPEANPFSQPLALISAAELIAWVEVSDRLAAGPLTGDVALAAQRATVEAELGRRKLAGGPRRLTSREAREMREGAE